VAHLISQMSVRDSLARYEGTRAIGFLSLSFRRWFICNSNRNPVARSWLICERYGLQDKGSETPAPTENTFSTHCNTLQHTATHCNTLQHTATHSETPSPTDDTFSRYVFVCVRARTCVCVCV